MEIDEELVENNLPSQHRKLKKDKMKKKKKKKKDQDSDALQAIENPCYPPGYTVTLPSGYTHVGTGEGTLCMKHLDAVMEENSQGSCRAGQFCVDLLGDGIETPVHETFYAFTLFSYPIDFAKDIIAKMKDDNDGELPRGKEYKDLRKIDEQLKSDNPSIKTLRDVTDVACAWDYPYLQEALPEEDRIAFRCMELGLSTVLLTKFGFPKTGHNIHFTDEIGGASAEWTLGAYLHLLNHDDSARDSGRGWYIHPTNLVNSMSALDSGLLYSDVAILTFALAALALCVRCLVKRSWVDSVSHHAKDGVKTAVGRFAPPTRSVSMPVRY